MITAIISGGAPAGAIPAGTVTTARPNASDKDADITISSDRIVTIANGAAGGVRFTVSFDPSTDKRYGEMKVATQTTETSSNYWQAGFWSSGVSLANASGGVQLTAADLYTQSLHYFQQNTSVNGSGPTRINASLIGPIATNDVLQWVIAYGYLFWGRNGALSGLTDAQAQAGLNAAGSFTTCTLFVAYYLDGTGAVDPSLEVPATTNYAAPAIPGIAIY